MHQMYMKCVSLRGRLADVLDALHWIDGVGAAQDAGGKHDRQGVGRHAVRVLL